ncbi:MAG: TetR/AcrR family transcriptional regulator of autoinduction and epiphytic fitness [Planctomycetota bacterium]|jgi:TetR/AcrR family transcriptional regulator of autoinduction and epiphytic fitness
MAQRSKKDHIAQSALPLFLQNGFKGTSVDMVVKQSAVSKPTVYNHFPDKSALILAVIDEWLKTSKPSLPTQLNENSLTDLIENRWLSNEAVGLYAMVIGEGRRFTEARAQFWEQYDQRWRQAIHYAASASMTISTADMDCRLDRSLLNRLKRL